MVEEKENNELKGYVIDLGAGIAAGGGNTTASVRESSAMYAPLEVNDENSKI